MNEWALGGLIERFSMLQTVDESEVNLGRYKKHLLYSKTEINQAGIGSNFPQFTRRLTARATRMPPSPPRGGKNVTFFLRASLIRTPRQYGHYGMPPLCPH